MTPDAYGRSLERQTINTGLRGYIKRSEGFQTLPTLSFHHGFGSISKILEHTAIRQINFGLRDGQEQVFGGDEIFAHSRHRLFGAAPAQEVEPAVLFHGQFGAAFAIDALAQLRLVGHRHVGQHNLARTAGAFAHLVEVGQGFR